MLKMKTKFSLQVWSNPGGSEGGCRNVIITSTVINKLNELVQGPARYVADVQQCFCFCFIFRGQSLIQRTELN